MIFVDSGLVANADGLGIDGYEPYGEFLDFDDFRKHLDSLPEGEKPSCFVGFKIGDNYYDNNLEFLGNKEEAWGKDW